MDASTKIAAGALVVALISAGISLWAVCESRRLQENQWKHDELVIRRDILRRLAGNCYRLTPEFQGQEGEPFTALNEAWVMYADFPQVIEALDKIHDELGERIASTTTL